MSIPQTPNRIPEAFGGGSVPPLPDTTTTPGRASWETGFPAEVGGTIKNGGYPVNKADVNSVLNELSQHAVYQQTGALYKWSDELDYPVGAHVQAFVEVEGNPILSEFVCKKENGPGVEAEPVDPEQPPVYVGPKDPAEDTTGEFWQNLTVLLDRVKAGAGVAYGTSSTAGNVVDKEVDIQDFALLVGTTVEVLFVNANTADSPTLNVSGTGAIPLQSQGAALPSGTIKAGSVYQFVYDGTAYQMVGGGGTEAATELPEAPGTANTGTSLKYAREDHVHPAQTVPSASNETPLAPADTGDAGTSSSYSRADHVHPKQAGGGGGGIKGMVVAFSGTFGGTENRNPIPLGETDPDTSWVLCDGGSDGSGGTVPDLRGRMLIGVSSSYAKDSIGGSETHSHSLSGSTSSASVSGSASGSTASASPSGMSVSGSVGSTTLTTTQIPSHSHQVRTQENLTVGGSSAHRVMNWDGTGTVRNNVIGPTGGSSSHTHSLSGLSVSGGSHSHTISSLTISGGSHSHTNSGSAASTTAMPPYYALAYIIKVA